METRTKEDLKAELTKTAGLLSQLRDEAKVKIHLAGMDIREAWDNLAPKIEEAEKLAAKAADTVSEATLETVRATHQSLQKLLKSL